MRVCELMWPPDWKYLIPNEQSNKSLKQSNINPTRYLPWCLVISISCDAARAPFNAPSTTASGVPTNVYTVRLVDIPGSTSSRLQPSVLAIALAMASITWNHRNRHYIWHFKPEHTACPQSLPVSPVINEQNYVISSWSLLKSVLKSSWLELYLNHILSLIFLVVLFDDSLLIVWS